MCDNEAIKDNINVAVKHYIFTERERIKEEIVGDAMREIRKEMQYVAVSDDSNSKQELPQRHKNSVFEKSSQEFEINENSEDYKDARSARMRKKSNNKPKVVNTSHHHGRSKSKDKNPISVKKVNTKHHHGNSRSRSKDSLSKKSSFITNNSKKTYDFDFESENERAIANKNKSKRHKTKHDRNASRSIIEITEVQTKTPVSVPTLICQIN